MISCLCVTRGDRLSMLGCAIGDFSRQSFAERELLIVHDAPAATARAIEALAATISAATIRIERAEPGSTLGALRNVALAGAAGDWVCQWDDDDRYHPDRLSLQWAEAAGRGAAVNYLVDQLHWFRTDGLLYWDDWNAEPYPMNVIQGSILARRDIMPPYPELPRGEDTLQTHALMRRAAESGFGVSRLHGAGWCYVYSHHGANVWGAEHHRAISAAKHLPAARLVPRLADLRTRLAQYEPRLPALRMPVGGDWTTV